MGNKQFFGKKQLKELYATYGELNLYNSASFKPLTRNLTTGAILSRGHHCERCKQKVVQGCYDDFHYGFCPQWVTRKGQRVRCGERFAVHSDGCGKHPRCQGYNKPFYRAAEGDIVNLSEFDDTDHEHTDDECDCQEDDMEADIATIEDMAEQYFKEHGHIPAEFYNEQYALISKEKAYKKEIANSVASSIRPSTSNGASENSERARRHEISFSAPQKRNMTIQSSIKASYASKRGNRSTFAPKGSKPKLPMEAPNYPADQSEDKKNPGKNQKESLVQSMRNKWGR